MYVTLRNIWYYMMKVLVLKHRLLFLHHVWRNTVTSHYSI